MRHLFVMTFMLILLSKPANNCYSNVFVKVMRFSKR